MKNLILNSRWCPGPWGGPMYFSGNGSTYDDFTINGCRTCSITMYTDCKEIGRDIYNPAISVCGKQCICWGYCIRAIDAACIVLVADFFDASHSRIIALRCPIKDQITNQFHQIMGRFPIPSNASTVKLSMEFTGKITACTFYAPTAYFC